MQYSGGGGDSKTSPLKKYVHWRHKAQDRLQQQQQQQQQ